MDLTIADDATTDALHIGFVTDDLERTAHWLARLLGLPTPVVGGTQPPELSRPRYHGEAALLGCRQVNMQWGPLGLEVIEPDEHPSSWRDFLERHGPGVHHLGFATRELDANSRSFADAGYPTVQEGVFPGGQYAYVDTQPALGILVELLRFEPDPRP